MGNINMTHLAWHLLFFSSLSLFLTISRAESIPPHGLAYENPRAFSPSAIEFFHPKAQAPETRRNTCGASGCSPLPMTAHVKAANDQTQESKISSETHRRADKIGAGGIVGFVFGLAFAALLAMGVYYVVIKRRANMSQENAVQPDA